MLNGFNSNYFNFGLNSNPWGSGVNLNFGTASSGMSSLMPIGLGNSLFSSGMSMPMMNPMMPGFGLGGGIFGSGMPSAFGGGILSGQVQDPTLMKDWQKTMQDDIKSRSETAAQNAYEAAFEREGEAISDYNELNDEVKTLEQEVESLYTKADNCSKALAEAQDKYDKTKNPQDKNNLDQAKEAYEEAKDELKEKQNELKAKQRETNKAKNNIKKMKTAKERVEKEARRLGLSISTSTQDESISTKHQVKHPGLFLTLTARNTVRQDVVGHNSSNFNSKLKLKNSAGMNNDTYTAARDDVIFSRAYDTGTYNP